jgi:hypothetical protein
MLTLMHGDLQDMPDVYPDGGRNGLPHPGQLAALGTVLCLYRPALGSELEGWARAVDMASQMCVDSDGLRESLCFYDRNDQCCWRLCLLPDSDFLAWDRLVSAVRVLPERDAEAGVGERLWRRLAGRVRGDAWRLSVIRLHAAGGIGVNLAASLATVSPLGANVVRRIARMEGAEGGAAYDECCCARAAVQLSDDSSVPMPLVRF